MVSILLSQFPQINSWDQILSLVGIVGGIYILVALTLLLIEKSFYSIIMPHCFYGDAEHSDFERLYQLWKSFFWRYVSYITYYWLAMIGMIVLFGAIILLEPFSWSIAFIFAYVYINVRLVIAWYSTFFLPSYNHNYLTNSWNLLGWKVWSTFVKTFVFFLIISIGSGISSYIAQLFTPNTNEYVLQVIGQFSQMIKNGSQTQDMLHTFRAIDRGPIVYSVAIFLIFSKITKIVTEAMRHVFLMEYYKDISNNEPIFSQNK